MIHGAEAFVAFDAEPGVAALKGDARAAFVYDRSGRRLLWLNAAGAAFLGAADYRGPLGAELPADDPLARQIARVAAAAGPGRLERLRVFKGLCPVTLTCRVARLRAAGEAAVLIAVVDGPAIAVPAAELATRHAAFAAALAAPVAAPPAAAPPPPAADTAHRYTVEAGAGLPIPRPAATPDHGDRVEAAASDVSSAPAETAAPVETAAAEAAASDVSSAPAEPAVAADTAPAETVAPVEIAAAEAVAADESAARVEPDADAIAPTPEKPADDVPAADEIAVPLAAGSDLAGSAPDDADRVAEAADSAAADVVAIASEAVEPALNTDETPAEPAVDAAAEPETTGPDPVAPEAAPSEVFPEASVTAPMPDAADAADDLDETEILPSSAAPDAEAVEAPLAAEPAASAVDVPDEVGPDETATDETPTDAIAPVEVRPDETAQDEIAADEAVSNETAFHGFADAEAAPDETAPDEIVADEAVSSETALDEFAADETAPDETAPEFIAADEVASDEVAPDESALDEPAPDETALDAVLGGPLEAAPDTAPAATEPAAEAAATSADAGIDASAAATTRFAPPTHGRPVRFVFELDAETRFDFVSPDLAATVGPDAGAVVGETWSAVAARLQLDPPGRIAAALARRDTFTSREVSWPVDDQALALPVGLTGMPVFARDRSFRGYRGFGVCRTDAPQPLAAPLTGAAAGVPHPAEPASEAVAPAAEPATSDAPAPVVPAAAAAAPAFRLGSMLLAAVPAAALASDATPPSATEGAREPRPAAGFVDDPAPDEAGPLGAEVAEATPADVADAAPSAWAAGEASETATYPADADMTPAEAVSIEPSEEPAADATDAVGPSAMETAADPSLPGADRLFAPEMDTGTDATDAALQADGDAPGADTGPAGLDADVAAQQPETDVPDAEPQASEPQPLLFDLDGSAAPSESPEAEVAPEAPGMVVDADGDPIAEIEPAAEPLTDAAPATEPEVVAGIDTDSAIGPEAEADAASATGDVSGIDVSGIDAEAAAADEPVATSDEPTVAIDAAPVAMADYGDDDAGLLPEAEELTGDEELVPESAAEPVDSDSDADTRSQAASDAAPDVAAADIGPDAPNATPAAAPAAPETALTVDPAAAAAQDAAPPADIDTTPEAIPASEAVAITPEDAITPPESPAPGSPVADAPAPAAVVVRAAPEQVAPVHPGAQIIPSPVVPRLVRTEAPATGGRELSRPEREAFRQIAEALGARYDEPVTSEPRREPVRPAPRLVPPQPTTVDATVLDRLPVAMVILQDGEAVTLNRAFLELVGFADADAFAAAGGIAQAFAGRALRENESQAAIRRADGVERPVTATLHAIQHGGGPASLIVLRETVDTTAPERATSAEQRLAELEAILDTATDGVVVVDAAATVIGCNRSAEALFGAERADIVGRRFIELLAPESHRAALDYLDGLARNGVASVLNDGREVIGAVSQGGYIPLFMTMGRVSGDKFCAVLRDITHWKRVEEELTTAKRQAENASSQKSEFLAKISHEIRTPLNAIIGFSEVMMEERFGQVGSERYKEYLRDINMSGNHIMSLVNDLLDLSKIEAGKLDLSFEAVAVNDVLRDCVALMQPQANRERIIIRTSLSSVLPNVVADARSLRQIVLNLLSNAVKFTPQGGQVIVSSIYEDNGEVALRVRDTGVGMSPTDIQKALEPFRQLHTTRAGRGTGLGLPLTKALVEANRAHFRIDSGVGQGTLVQVTFPSTRVLAE
ncbi:ATP-binding protein [Methylobrevis albus]|uniref:histidine kinase n=1 Tax=Methylobrevis albus TaxID=2793297 RepID=A0A931I2L6_9HYPH|nr:ATP-binding protein [Methylobrevis albus]MBH0238289.1 PAS domain S-box protein [Methylobrevis albus]